MSLPPLGAWLNAVCHAGAKTGRSPRDKRVVREPESEKDIWWAAADNAPSNGSPNYEMDEKCVFALCAVLIMLLGACLQGA